jgi:RNA polymerase sigma factor (sigma-70 family)
MVRQLEALFEGASVSGLSDRELLLRFNDAKGQPGGEAAFAALVQRHGPMVLGVCRQILGDVQRAEDCFQAVFLVLAQKAWSIRDPDLLGNWLYGVATRTARCAKQKFARTRMREERDGMIGPGWGLGRAAEITAPPADLAAIDCEQAEAIHGEVDRLPRAFRLPVVLCYFEGLTLDEAARRLRCPAGTLRSRLARAREKLRVGLTRRGVALPAAALAAVLAPRSSSASVSPLLCESTTRAATAFAARHAVDGALSTSSANLAREVLRTMLIHKLKIVAMTLVGFAAITTGVGLATRSLAMKEDTMENLAPPASVGRGSPDPAPLADRRFPELDPPVADRESPEPEPALTEPRPSDIGTQPARRMNVTGRVFDPDGKPVEGAVVELVESPRVPWVGASLEIARCSVSGQARSDRAGRFQIDAPRTSSTRVWEVGVLVSAPGLGLGWATLNPDAPEPTALIKLPPAETVRVRLVDVSGAPAKGVAVQLLSVSQPDSEGKPIWIGVGRSLSSIPRSWPGRLSTDDQGQIAIKRLGRGATISLGITDLRYAEQDLYVDPAGSEAVKVTTLALQPARLIEGRVLAADTGKPIPNAIVAATSRVHNEHANGFFTTKVRADDSGRFTINPIAGQIYKLGAFPACGEPYLVHQEDVKLTRAQVKATHDIKLPRGVLIRGKVTEKDTSRPLPAASIQYSPVAGDEGVLSGWQAIVASEEDGSFKIAVSAGKGHLLIFGPTSEFVLDEIGSNRLDQDRPGGRRHRAHAIIPYEVKSGDSPHEINVALRPGLTVKGRVEGPDGQTVASASIITTLHIEPFNPFWRGDFQIPVRDGRFELPGLSTEERARVHFLDAEHEWGTTVEISGKQAGDNTTIHLQPCGKAVARFVGPDGRPVARHHPHIEFVATSGPSEDSRSKEDQARLTAEADFAGNVDRKHFPITARTDAEGRFTMNALIPGATYRITDRTAARGATTQIQVRKEFVAKSGEILDLGDILIEKPDA